MLLRQEDSVAFEEIFIRYEPLLLSFSYKKLVDKDKAKYILQEILSSFGAIVSV